MDVSDIPVVDYFDAVPVGDGVLVRMSDNAEKVLANRIGGLVRFLAEGVVEPPDGKRRRLGGTSAAKVEQRMFPDAYRRGAESDDFRDRNRARLRDTGPACRVLERCLAGSPFVLDAAGVDDWVATLGLLRLLYHPRKAGRGRPDVGGLWYQFMLEHIVLAADPGLASGWEEAARAVG